MRVCFLVWMGLVLPMFCLSQNLHLNELVSNNDGAYTDEDGDSSDWVELYNSGSEEISLQGYFISDDDDDLQKWEFPATPLGPMSYKVVFCSSKDRITEPLHTNFQVKSSGERLYLSDSQGNIIDQIEPRPLAEGFSLARICAETCYWEIMNSISPGEDNMEQSIVSFSHPSGVYATDIELLLYNPLDHEIRYTLDGSVPDENSPLYTEALNLSDASSSESLISTIATSPYWEEPSGEILKINVIRARTFVAGIPTSQVFSKNYAIGNEVIELFNEYPVFSFQCHADSLFGEERGIHVPGVNFDQSNTVWSGNYFMRGVDWERDIHITYFEESEAIWAQEVGVRIHGGKTRNGPQKSFRLYARNELGAGEFHHQFFDTKEKTVFDKLLLRCHFGCWNKTIIKDELTSYVCRDLNFESQHSRPCVVFINGEYWGLFAIRDFIDSQFIEEEYSFHQDSVDILNHGSGYRPNVDPDWGIYEGENDHYAALMDFIENADMTDFSNFEYIQTQMDVSSMIDYYATQIFFAQKDWPAGNHKVWRGGYEGTKWRWILFDTDSGWGYLGPTNNTMIRATTTTSNNYSNPPWATFLFRKMLESPEFEDAYKARLACLMRNEFSPETLGMAIDRFVNFYTPEMPRNLDRWHLLPSMAIWTARISSELINFGEERRPHLEEHIAEFFDSAYNVDEYDCSSNPLTVEEEVPGIQMAIYPNPSSDRIWIDVNSSEKDGQLRIYDIQGRQVYADTYQFHQQIQTSGFSDGLYIITIQFEDSFVTERFVKR